ncbi:RagB/SusD family nutrient uptake outer membrane protein [Compostibacter hankyongensis]|uniref:RagB/SusD family nutrient uptake outer membrane protein n=1 Tax=Compostibacter hankyongensis TaxID=1007089 RepID=A0ABP8G4H2_9BACT
MIEVSPPKMSIPTSSIFTNAKLLESALLNCCYTLDYEGSFLNYLGLYVDELSTSSLSTNIPDYLNGEINSEVVSGNYTVWKSLYSVIYQTNLIINGLPFADIADSIKAGAEGESRFLRAYCYFYLVNIWGGVPLITTAEVDITSHQPRNTPDEIYEQIVSDLKEARGKLKGVNNTGEKIRASEYAALAMLSRVYLYNKRWGEAITASTEIINSGLFTVNASLPDIEGVFNSDSKGAIFQLWNQNGYSKIGLTFAANSTTSPPSYYISNDLYNSFEQNDRRRSYWLKPVIIDDSSYNAVYKYKLSTAGAFKEFSTLLRIAEQYLIRAEARAETGDLKGAVQDVNMVRERAGLAPLSESLDEEEVVDAILHERRIEFFCEGGHRFFDLKRIGKINAVMKSLKPAWKATAALFPVPQGEIDANPFLTQNPGYN